MNWLKRRQARRAERPPAPSNADELRLAALIDGAWINERHHAGDIDDPEPRIYLSAPSLGTFTTENAERRFRKAFPSLSEAQIDAAMRHLVDRVAGYVTERTVGQAEPRRSFVHGWAADRHEIFRL